MMFAHHATPPPPPIFSSAFFRGTTTTPRTSSSSSSTVRRVSATTRREQKINAASVFEDAEKAIEIPKNAEGIKKSIQRQIATGTIATVPTSFDDEDMYQA